MIRPMTPTVDDRTQHRLVLIARSGFIVTGILHVIIGVLAVRIGLGTMSGQASSGGALAAIAQHPVGQAALWVAVLAMGALAIWYFFNAYAGAREGAAGGLASAQGDPKDTARDAASALKMAGKGVVYLAITFTAFTYAAGGSSSGEEMADDITAVVLQYPAGQWVIGAVGLAIGAVGIYHVVSGVTGKFLDNLRGLPEPPGGQAVRVLGHVGYAAKGIALGAVGVLFVIAAAQSDPDDAGGLDQALRVLGEQPFGTAILVVVGVGFVSFGVFAVVRARYTEV